MPAPEALATILPTSQLWVRSRRIRLVSYLPRYDSQRSEVAHLKMWVEGNAPTTLASSSSSTTRPSGTRRDGRPSKAKTEVRRAAQLELKGKVFSILTAALDVTERAEVAAPDRR